MNTLDCIKTRRSIRLFLDKGIPHDTIEKIIDSGLNAPSSRNCQPWHFIVIKDDNTKKRIANLKEEENRNHILTAPILIIVCVDKDKSPSRFVEDGVCASQNILLATNDLNLGSVYVTGSNPTKPEVAKNIQEILNLPDNITPITILPIGYPDSSEKLEEKVIIDKKEVTHYDKW